MQRGLYIEREVHTTRTPVIVISAFLSVPVSFFLTLLALLALLAGTLEGVGKGLDEEGGRKEEEGGRKEEEGLRDVSR